MAYTVEKKWTTDAGYKAVVLMTDMGHRCGYVAVPAGHVLDGQDYSEACPGPELPDDEPVGKRGIFSLLCARTNDGQLRIDAYFNVHGSITYADRNTTGYPAKESDGLWYFGFDAAHDGDNEEGGRSFDYMVAECESLAEQFKTVQEATT